MTSQNAQRTARLGFYKHLIVYACVNLLLLVINLTNSPDALWVMWPAAGWGIGVFVHALSVFVFREYETNTA